MAKARGGGAWVYVMPRDDTQIQRTSVCCVDVCCFSICMYRPEISRGYPLNLSILLSGGKENNNDSLSNGE